ncbi:MAG: hypothetical protein ABI970_09350 [Chloroflexota bacterium]
MSLKMQMAIDRANACNLKLGSYNCFVAANPNGSPLPPPPPLPPIDLAYAFILKLASCNWQIARRWH